jgi:glucan 1,3-beta-glucosidase
LNIWSFYCRISNREIGCGNAIVNGGGPAPDGNAGCNMACKGNSAETCGGGNRLDVYSYGSGGTPTTSITAASSPTVTAGSGGNPLPGWTFLGCYTDNVSERALPVSVTVSGGNTNEGCQSACLSAGYVIAGTEYSGECCKHLFSAPIKIYLSNY